MLVRCSLIVVSLVTIRRRNIVQVHISQPTTASAKRSFSMLKKLLVKDRNFKVENVQHYMILHLSKSTAF